MIKIISPTYVILPRKTKADKKIYLNLNQYRNMHYQISNQAKRIYNDQMEEQLSKLKLQTPINMVYSLKRKGKRIVDSMNYYAIISKFFCDSLTHYGCIPDDSDEYIGFNTFAPTEYDTAVDECVVEIYEA